jgi:nitrite reductase (NADH) small subunit
MIEARFEIEVAYKPETIVEQYFDIEHIEHVHPKTFGKGILVHSEVDKVIWDLLWPSFLGFRARTRFEQFHYSKNNSDYIEARAVSGFAMNSATLVTITPTEKGARVQELHRFALPIIPLVKKFLTKIIERHLAKIWAEDLAVGVCYGGFPGTGRILSKREHAQRNLNFTESSGSSNSRSIPLEQLPILGSSKRFTLGNNELVVHHSESGYLASIGRCPHRGAPLELGGVVDGELVCPWHGWRFDVDTGNCPRNGRNLRIYQVELTSKGLLVKDL